MIDWTPEQRLERWYRRSITTTSDGCHIWTGSLTRNGYGQVVVRGVSKMAHRAVYEIVVGEVAPTLDLDHLCRNRACVNPAHLEPVTRSENLRRGWSASPRPAKTHCKRGHEFTVSNTRITPVGTRSCRACTNLLARQRRRVD